MWSTFYFKRDSALLKEIKKRKKREKRDSALLKTKSQHTSKTALKKI